MKDHASPNCFVAKFDSSDALIIFPTTRELFGFREGKVLSDCTELVGRKEAIRLIDEQIGLHGEAIWKHLAQYDARGALPTWHGIIRDIEEFINVVLYGDIDDEKSLRLMHLRVGAGLVANPNVALLARGLVAPYYGEALAKRFMITMLRVTRAMVGFQSDGRGLDDGSQVYSVADAAGYFQSRRRHFVSLLYMVPEVCSGTRPLAPEMAFNELLPIVEHCCISFTGWNWKGVLAEGFKDFTLAADKRGAYASHEYDALESVFLEPERVSLLDIHQQRGGDLTSTRVEPQDPAKIFSAPELRNNVRFIQTAYDAFGLNDDEYSTLSLLVSAFSRYCEDDYFIRIEIGKFRSMLAAQTVFPSVELERMLLGGDAHFKQAPAFHAVPQSREGRRPLQYYPRGPRRAREQLSSTDSRAGIRVATPSFRYTSLVRTPSAAMLVQTLQAMARDTRNADIGFAVIVTPQEAWIARLFFPVPDQGVAVIVEYWPLKIKAANIGRHIERILHRPRDHGR